MTELLENLPDRLLLLFRSKLASRLRSDTGMHGIMKMVKLVPSVTARASSTNHTALHRSMSSILDTRSSLNGLLDTSHDNLFDGAFALSLERQPVSLLFYAECMALTVGHVMLCLMSISYLVGSAEHREYCHLMKHAVKYLVPYKQAHFAEAFATRAQIAGCVMENTC